jgi:hypothetical protein
MRRDGAPSAGVVLSRRLKGGADNLPGLEDEWYL